MYVARHAVQSDNSIEENSLARLLFSNTASPQPGIKDDLRTGFNSNGLPIATLERMKVIINLLNMIKLGL